MSTSPQLLPLRRPWWLAVIAAMLVFGFYQELAKINLNDYIQTLETHPELQTLNPHERAAFWSNQIETRIVQYYEIHEPWSAFHNMDMTQLLALKWSMSVLIILVFFGMDALFLRASDAGSLRAGLLAIYLFVGLVMLLFASFAPGEGGYSVARELLGFLQSPLPSFMLVFMRWIYLRMNGPCAIN